MTKHTPEPWSVKPGPKIIGNGEDFLGMPISVARLNLTVGHYESEEANARRIVACVNACKGLPTQELEEIGIVGVVGRELIELDAKLASVTAQRDELDRRVQSLIGSQARYSTEMQIAEDIIDPDWDGERTPLELEYDHPIHDKIIGLKTDIESLKAERDTLKVEKDKLIEVLTLAQNALAQCKPDRGYAQQHTNAAIMINRAIGETQ